MAPSTLPLFKWNLFSWLIIRVLQAKYFSTPSDTSRPFLILNFFIILQIQLPFLLLKHYHSWEKVCVYTSSSKSTSWSLLQSEVNDPMYCNYWYYRQKPKSKSPSSLPRFGSRAEETLHAGLIFPLLGCSRDEGLALYETDLATGGGLITAIA